MNYKLLLWKYINHVGQCEGSIFDPGGYHRDASSIKFTEAELAAFAELNNSETPPEESNERGG